MVQSDNESAFIVKTSSTHWRISPSKSHRDKAHSDMDLQCRLFLWISTVCVCVFVYGVGCGGGVK